MTRQVPTEDRSSINGRACARPWERGMKSRPFVVRVPQAQSVYFLGSASSYVDLPGELCGAVLHRSDVHMALCRGQAASRSPTYHCRQGSCVPRGAWPANRRLRYGPRSSLSSGSVWGALVSRLDIIMHAVTCCIACSWPASHASPLYHPTVDLPRGRLYCSPQSCSCRRLSRAL